MADLIERASAALRRGHQFFTRDVWRVGQPGESVPTGYLIKNVRVVILLVQNLVKNALLLRASALAFTSMLALVPLMALMFFMIETFSLDKELYAYLARALQLDQVEFPLETAETAPDGISGAREESADEFKRQVTEFFLRIFPETESPPGQPEYANPIEKVMEYAQRGANPHAIRLVGVLFILSTVFGLIWNIEAAFNQIWGIRDTRSWYRMFSDYLTMVVLLPFFVTGMVTLSIVLRHVDMPLNQAIIYRMVQYAIIWTCFSGLYYFVPNTRVKARYAVLGGIVAGTLWNVLNWGYITFQYGLSSYSIFYSTLAQVPVLLMWLYFSWVILLFGAELTFAYQNEKTFALERFAGQASYAYREALGLRTMVEIAKRFHLGLPGLAAEEASRAWNVPIRLLNDTLQRLEDAGLLALLATDPPRYQPARPLGKIRAGDVINALREAGTDPAPLRGDEAFRSLLDRLSGCRNGFYDVSFHDIVRETLREPRTELEFAAAPRALPAPDQE